MYTSYNSNIQCGKNIAGIQCTSEWLAPTSLSNLGFHCHLLCRIFTQIKAVCKMKPGVFAS